MNASLNVANLIHYSLIPSICLLVIITALILKIFKPESILSNTKLDQSILLSVTGLGVLFFIKTLFTLLTYLLLLVLILLNPYLFLDVFSSGRLGEIGAEYSSEMFLAVLMVVPTLLSIWFLWQSISDVKSISIFKKKFKLVEQDLTEERLETGDFIPRCKAAVIDLLILTFILSIELLLKKYFSIESVVLTGIIFSIIFFYKLVMEYFFGATFGKMYYKLKITNREGAKLEFLNTLIRISPWFFMYTIVLMNLFNMNIYGGIQLTSCFFIISIVFFFFTKNKRTLHDLLAKGYCIQSH